MTSMHITAESIPSLQGKVAVVTGGSSGIGLAAVEVLVERRATVYVLDKYFTAPDNLTDQRSVQFITCDVTSWAQLVSAFERIGIIDLAFANAGISEDQNFLQDVWDDSGRLVEPTYGVINVNFRAVLNFIKLSCRAMKERHRGGSIVITSSATAYAPEHSLPVYGAVKAGLVSLVRSLRTTLPLRNITINGVAPSATATPLVPNEFLDPISAVGLPISSPNTVALAMVYSATATGIPCVELYGKDQDSQRKNLGRWNGRVIVTLGESYTEVEGPLADLRTVWLGDKNATLVRKQQAATDSRSRDRS